jgi:hypothetical protein
MKKVKSETVSFQPIIHVHDNDYAWVISFDSGSDRDTKRAPRIVFVPKGDIKHLELNIVGFNALSDNEDLSIIGLIELEAKYSNAETIQTFVLAACEFLPWAQHRQLTAGATVLDVVKAVRNGTADAFTAVLPGLFPARGGEPLQDEAPAANALPRQSAVALRGGVRSAGRPSRTNRLQQWMPRIAMGGVVVVGWLVSSVIWHSSSSPQAALTATSANPPDMQAVLQNQLQPPAGPDSQVQVELVKNTLKSMGLDPGASGDTGCLVQPH